MLAPRLLCHAPGVESFGVAGGLVLLSDQSRLFAYNETAAILWERLREGAAHEDLSEQLTLDYGLPPDQAHRDAQTILNDWLSKGLIEPWRGGAGPGLANPCSSEPERDAPAAQPSKRYGRLSSVWTAVVARHAMAFSVDCLELGALLRQHFPESDCEAPDPTTRIRIGYAQDGRLLLAIDDRERVRTESAQEVVGALIRALLDIVHPGLERLAVIHGGAVARDGRGYAFAAPSGSGKSTLLAYLCGQGYRYLSDDIVTLSSPQGLIVPFPVALSIKPGSVQALARHYPDLPEARTLPSGKGDLRFIRPADQTWTDLHPVAALIFPQYRPVGRPELGRLSTLDGIVRLFSDDIWLGYPTLPKNVTAFLDWLQDVPAYALDFRNVEEAGRLLQLLTCA
jgi:hypothetical protein